MQACGSLVPRAALDGQLTKFEAEFLQELSGRIQSPLRIGIGANLKCKPILCSNVIGNVDSPLPPSRIGNEIDALLVANLAMVRSKVAQMNRRDTAGLRFG